MTSLPEAFVSRIEKQFPQHHIQLIESFDKVPRTSVHVNQEKAPSLWSHEEPVKWFRHGRLLTERPSFTLDPLFHAGCYYPQESSSMILYEVLEALFKQKADLTFLDLCASPGGKSLLLSSFLGNEGRVISNEINRQRNQILKENLVKWGSSNVIVTCNEPEKFTELQGYFDCVLVDAPCSGEGMFRKDLNARNEWSEENVRLCSVRQKSILTDILPSIKNGGYLVYSTCTFAKEENELNCEWLLESGMLEPVAIDVHKEWNIEVIHESGIHALQFLPDRVEGEGFFVAVFRKHGGPGWFKVKTEINFERSLEEKEIVSKWTKEIDHLVKAPDEEFYASPFSVEELNEFARFLYITMPGISLGRIVREDFLPEHALALSGTMSSDIPTVELNREEALAYLRGDTNFTRDGIGWHVATFEGHPLGWMKLIKNRVNNYYPKEWRIRMR